MKTEFLDAALQAVKAAEDIIMAYYAGDVQTAIKSDMSPVTVADKESEAKIKEVIRNAFPDHGFLGEESGDTEAQSAYRWVIDPIDGTKNYIRELPFFTTQLALMRDEDIILGVSNAPLLEELFRAERGKGAYANDKPVRVSDVAELDEAFISFGGIKYFEEIGFLPNLMDLTKATRQQRGFGDSWSYHLLATGKIDAVLEAKTKLWDIAAITVIVEEAGGKVTDFRGNRVTEETTAIVATNGLIHDEVLRLFN